ncbi:MAG: Uma2 family endonuclease [Cyanothece sp. SIO1E1]|nr:Uma2 family endonuclease [Cyanothece sp. SIO1E1]
MVQAASKQLTLEEFLKLPEMQPAQEYIDGQVIQKPMPQGKHSKIQWEMLTTINTLAKPTQIAHAFPELRCTFNGRSIVPDVVVLLWQRIPLDQNGEVANIVEAYPDWTIEILSPGQSQTKVTSNILHCLEHGCSLDWLVDPGERCVLAFPPGKQPKVFHHADDALPTPRFLAELTLTVGQLFSWLKL